MGNSQYNLNLEKFYTLYKGEHVKEGKKYLVDFENGISYYVHEDDKYIVDSEGEYLVNDIRRAHEYFRSSHWCFRDFDYRRDLEDESTEMIRELINLIQFSLENNIEGRSEYKLNNLQTLKAYYTGRMGGFK